MKMVVASIAATVVMGLSIPVAFADDSVIAQSNAVQITGGYEEPYTVQTYEQTGTTTQRVSVQTGGGYYTTEQVFDHYDATSYILDGVIWYVPVPVYRTETVWVPPRYSWVNETVPVYGYVDETEYKWDPVVIDNNGN